MTLFSALVRRVRAALETDHDLEVFRKRAARALAVFPEGYARGARAYRDPIGRTRLILLLDSGHFPTDTALQYVIGLLSAQGGSYHLDDVATPELEADPIDGVPMARAIVADVAWF
jgi:hypothetical protein